MTTTSENHDYGNHNCAGAGKRPRRTGTRRPSATPSQCEAEREVAKTPGWKVTRRTTRTADGHRVLACRVGDLAVDVHIGRGGARTYELRDPASILETAVIASLIDARNEVTLNG